MFDVLERTTTDAQTGPPDRVDDQALDAFLNSEDPSDDDLDETYEDSDPAEPGEEPVDESQYELDEIPSDDTLSLYLKEVSRVPLLTREQEVQLAATLHDGRQAERKLRQNGHAGEERQRLLEAVSAGEQARQHLIRANTRLVVSVAKKYVGRGVPFTDLIQEGNLGLIKAVERFDHTRGFRLSTYATWWIRQTVARAVADQGRTIRVPVHMTERIHRLYKTVQRLEQELGHRPTPEQIAAEMELDVDRVRWMLKVSRHPLSLQRPVGEDQDGELGSFIEDESLPAPPESAQQSMLRDEIEDVLNTLTPREAQILRMRYGLKDGYSYTLEEIGQKFGLTRERIRQIAGDAVRRLRHPRRSRRLRDHVI